MIKDVADLRRWIHQYHLQRLEESLVQLAKPCIEMQRTAADEAMLPVGASKLGGHPDMPKGVHWPYQEDRPLLFIGQFRMSEIALHDAQGLLPRHGMLYFFADLVGAIFDADKQGKDCHIYYLEEETTFLT